MKSDVHGGLKPPNQDLFDSAGYECEVESLLDVNKQSSFRRDREHLKEAQELLKQLLDHSSLFPPGTQNRSRYLHVMVRSCSHLQPQEPRDRKTEVLLTNLHESKHQNTHKLRWMSLCFRTAWCLWTAPRTSLGWPRRNIPRRTAEIQRQTESANIHDGNFSFLFCLFL